MSDPISITIRYFGIFSQHTGCTREIFQVDLNTDIDGLLVMLCDRFGRDFTKALRADLDYRSAIVALNGEVVSGDATLGPDDEVVISYPAGGG